MTVTRVGVLMGGTSAERTVSLQTGAAVADALARDEREVVPLDLAPETDIARQIIDAQLDVAFLALHGRLGEDGCVQGMLEILGIPYTGSSVLSSALAMDKLKSKELFRLHNVPTPPYYEIRAEEGIADVEEAHGSFGYPAIVKPRREGSSVGVTRANSVADLAKGVRMALEHDDSVLVERFITGKEIAVGILDGRVLGAVEIEPKSGIYDFEAKYTPGMTEYHLPARLPPVRYRGVLNLAEQAARAVDATGAVRVDLLVTEGQNEYVLEVNTLPGMTPTSLLPKIAAAAGYAFHDLCEAILASARLHVAKARPQVQTSVPDATKSEEALPLRVAV
ncbi:MAG: D-alanine--D-alanine ligase [Polyangiaceae bacterium]